MKTVRNLLVGLLAGALVVTAAGCGADPVTLGASGAWARPTPPGAADGVVYLTLTSDRDDELVGAEVAEEVAGAATLHATTATGAGHHSHGAAAGEDVLGMSDLEAIPVAAGGTVTFAPGGNHIMLVGLDGPLERGDGFDLTLRLASGREVTVPVVVADNPPD